MAPRLLAAAGATLRGFVRDPNPAAALGLVAAATALGAALAPVALTPRFSTDLGWAAAALFGWLLALVHGSGLSDRGGVLSAPLLARPVPFRLLLGARLLGLAAGIAAYGGLSTLLIGVAAAASGQGTPAAAVMVAGWLLTLRLLVVLALALLLFVLVGRAAAPLAAAAGLAGWFANLLPPIPATGTANPLGAIAARLLPNMRLLSPPDGLPETGAGALAFLFVPTAYALLYGGALAALALAAGPIRWRRSGGVRR